jgi:D-amino peptidase
LNALVEGALAGGATEIIAWDGHGNFPGGIDVELVHPACKLITDGGDQGPLLLDSSFDALFLLGLHGMAGAKGGVMAHSFWRGIRNCWINGREYGEVTMNILTAGQCDVPLAFIAGDVAATAEARALVPAVEGAIVKWGLSEGGNLTLAPQAARDLIRAGAKRAMGRIAECAPVRLTKPYTLRTRYTEVKYADKAARRQGVSRLDDLTVEVTDTELAPLL